MQKRTKGQKEAGCSVLTDMFNSVYLCQRRLIAFQVTDERAMLNSKGKFIFLYQEKLRSSMCSVVSTFVSFRTREASESLFLANTKQDPPTSWTNSPVFKSLWYKIRSSKFQCRPYPYTEVSGILEQ